MVTRARGERYGTPKRGARDGTGERTELAVPGVVVAIGAGDEGRAQVQVRFAGLCDVGAQPGDLAVTGASDDREVGGQSQFLVMCLLFSETISIVLRILSKPQAHSFSSLLSTSTSAMDSRTRVGR